MPFTVKIDPRSGIALGAFSGACDAEAARQALTELWSTPRWNGQAALWDVRSARLDVTPEDVRSFAQYILSNQPATPPSRVAFVTGEDLDFGLMRMLEVYRTHPATETRVMRDYDEALAWVGVTGPRKVD